jgi:hypothetical protein
MRFQLDPEVKLYGGSLAVILALGTVGFVAWAAQSPLLTILSLTLILATGIDFTTRKPRRRNP